jgi:hypothetical protein
MINRSSSTLNVIAAVFAFAAVICAVLPLLSESVLARVFGAAAAFVLIICAGAFIGVAWKREKAAAHS